MATQSKTYKNLKKNRKELLSAVDTVQDKAIVIAEEMIELGVETGEKYQKIAIKAIKKSQPIIDNQMDIIFESFEELRAQYANSSKRFLKLLGIEKQTKQLRKDLTKTFVNVKGQIEETVADLSDKMETISYKKVKKEVTQVATKASKQTKAIKKDLKKLNLENLKVINGIGPKMESILKKAGIKNLNDLIKTDVKSLKQILNEAGPRYSKFNPSTMIKDAKKALLAK